MMALDEMDRRLVDRIQHDFPVVPRPFAAIGEALGIAEEEVLRRAARLEESGILRGIGAIFDLQRLGFASTLCAAIVRPDHVDRVAARISGYSEVTHNYLREHAYNVWFTVIAPSRNRIREILDRIRSETGVEDLLDLPAAQVFKIHVEFRADRGNDA